MITGIGDIAVYVPQLLMSTSRLEDRYTTDRAYPNFIGRAIKKTGQVGIRFPYNWEDSVTMAAQAAIQLLQRMSNSAISKLRYITVGTESATDMAKPIAAHVSGMLRIAGYPISENIATFQTQHACASGTLSLVGVNALIAQSKSEDFGLVICTDVARYEQGTTAEITQGAGAVAMIVEQNCGLVSLNVPTIGYASRDVDDFFRPVGALTPRVRGKFSIQMYRETLEASFLDHCRHANKSPHDVLCETDLFAFHAPFHRLPRQTLKDLVAKYIGLNEIGSEAFLKERDFDESIKPAAQCGNLYSGSLFLGLTHLLNHRFSVIGSNIVDQRILLMSYGSGNVAVTLAGSVTKKAPEMITKWNLEKDINHSKEARFEEYDAWMTTTECKDILTSEEIASIPMGSFYLNAIRKDGYRLYELRR